MPTLKCYYCPTVSNSLQDIVDHHVKYHKSSKLKVKQKSLDERSGKWGFQTKDFGFIHEDVLTDNNCLKCKEDTSEVFVQEEEENVLEKSFGNISILDEPVSNISPHPKKVKCTTPDKTGINIPFTDVKPGDITNEELELRTLLPDVIEKLRKNNQLENWW